MDIFNSIGKGFEDLSNQVKDLSIKGLYSAKEASNVAKLRMQIRELEAKILEEYTHLGEVYYMEMREQSHLADTTSSELLFAIDELQKEKASLENRMASKELDGEVFRYECPDCHTEINKDTNFCPHCGRKIETIELIADDPDFVECKNCHFQAEAGATYCPRCGTPLA